MRLSLTAQVAQQYFALIAADEQVAVTERTLLTRRETLTLFEKRVQAETLSEYDLHQAEAAAAATRSQLAALRQSQDRLVSALALLLGRSPRAAQDVTAAMGLLAGLCERWRAGELSNKMLSEVLQGAFADAQPLGDALAQHLAQAGSVVSDTGALQAAVDEVLARSQPQVERYRAGHTQVLGFLVGQVMKTLAGKGNALRVQEILKQKLDD